MAKHGLLTGLVVLSSTVALAAPVPASAAAVASRPLAGKVIVIDPGHNGLNYKHPGVINRLVPAGGFRKPCDTTGTSTNGGYAEHAFTFDVATRLAKILRARGATVRLTRPNDRGVGPCVNQRAAAGNRAPGRTPPSRSTRTARPAAAAAST